MSDRGAEPLARVLGERLGRILNTHFTTGDNSSKPQGIVTASSAGKTGTTESHRSSGFLGFTNQYADVMKAKIDAEPNMRAVLTRDSDFFVPLHMRVQKAQFESRVAQFEATVSRISSSGCTCIRCFSSGGNT